MFYADHFKCSLSWSISSDFGAIHSWNMHHNLKSRKVYQNLVFLDIKVIGTLGKFTSSACCVTQQLLCLSATVLMLDELVVVKWRFLRGYLCLMPSFEGIFSPRGTKFGHSKLEALHYHTVKTQSLYLTWACFSTETWSQDRQTELQ